ncbi:beta-glucosidase [Neorhodopirellula lusitana]|uniref:beta-glucosidase n=1 Tax=Neorhodopirellula lusitana TaxID=445327 RepID=A0ABY1QA68_9BACT|nr:beta-glucosidase BglX [Neorhodopirellula lusitana]SMP61499.1 beta-glucosidase [Neorhodopirellula lusitana]
MTKSIDDVEQLLSRMGLDEKIGQLNLVNPGGQVLTGAVASVDVDRKIREGRVGMMFGTASLDQRRDIQSICLSQTRLGIPMLFASDVIHGYRTALPLPIALACSWDTDLVRRAAHLSATEARADGIDLTFAPMVDVTRDPRWGRVAEGFGESSKLASVMSAAMVEGFQGDQGNNGTLLDVDRMAACVKHFAGYGAADGGREYASVNLGPIELHETHLPPFKSAIEAGVKALMPGFHALDRIPVTAHPDLLVEVLREAWRFDGLIISDYTAIAELIAHGLGDASDVAAAAMKATVDIDMVGETYEQQLSQLVRDKRVSSESIDMACRRVLTLKYELGLFEDPMRYLDPQRAKETIGGSTILREAREMVSRCCVLLRNEQNVLPLSIEKMNAQSTAPSIAIIGPLADDRSNLPGTWSVSADVDGCVSLHDGVRKWVGDDVRIETARGCNLTDSPQLAERLNVFGETVTIDERPIDAMVDEAVQVARSCDVVLLAIGEAKEHAGECSSRTELSLSQSTQTLARRLREAGRPIVWVVFSGRPLVLTECIDQADAVLYVWYGGSLSGPGIADVIFGKTNPSGRLCMSLPRSVGQIPVHHDALPTGRPLPKDVVFEKFKSCYLDESNDPLFPFGFGLTYSSVAYDRPSVTTSVADGDVTVFAELVVTNTGERSCEEVVQCYLHGPAAPVSRPVWKLHDFRRVTLRPGESKTVRFQVDPEAWAFFAGRRIGEMRWERCHGEARIGIGPNAAELVSTNVAV